MSLIINSIYYWFINKIFNFYYKLLHKKYENENYSSNNRTCQINQ